MSGKATDDQKGYSSRRKELNRRLNMLNGKFLLRKETIKRMDVIKQYYDDYGRTATSRFRRVRESTLGKLPEHEQEEYLKQAEEAERKFLIALQKTKDVASQGCLLEYASEEDTTPEFEGTVEQAELTYKARIQLSTKMDVIFDEGFAPVIADQCKKDMTSLYDLESDVFITLHHPEEELLKPSKSAGGTSEKTSKSDTVNDIEKTDSNDIELCVKHQSTTLCQCIGCVEERSYLDKIALLDGPSI